MLVGFNSQFDLKKPDAVFTPWGSAYAMDRDISFLGFATHMPNWYRDGWPEQKILSLKKEGFFKPFNRILVAGHSMGGYGALIAARHIPNATVVAFSPQSTLNRDVIDFDARFGRANRLDWSDPQSDAATAVAKLKKAWVFYDPRQEDDRRHAARLMGKTVTAIPCHLASHASFLFLNRMGIAQSLIDDIFEDSLSVPAFYKAYRARRHLDWYRNSLVKYLEKTDRTDRIPTIEKTHADMVANATDLKINRAAPDYL